jgi:hypothetical protein
LTTDLPLELSALSSLIDAQPAPVREAFRYCLALAMVEAGKARLVGQVPGEAGAVCTFETVAGEQFSLARLAMSNDKGAPNGKLQIFDVDFEWWRWPHCIVYRPGSSKAAPCRAKEIYTFPNG